VPAKTLLITGGTAPYTYLWSPGGETTEDITNLAAGTYSLTVTDTNGCTAGASYTVTEPPAITLITSTVDANCGQSDGEATVFASGGSGSYTYLWNDLLAQTTATATGLSAGSYSVIVTDSAGCSDTAAVIINDIGGGTAFISDSTDASCNGDCDGSATVSMSGGAAPFVYSWSPSGGSGATASNLCAGVYTVTVTDNAGCVVIASVTISEPAILAVSVSGNDAVCNGSCDGDATVSVSGGTAPFTYSWNTIPVQTTSTANSLCVGIYNITVTDTNGCTITSSVTIGEPLAITVALASNASHCGLPDGDATATPSNGTLPYTYSWNTIPVQTTANATGLLAGGYTVTITDLLGCTGTGTITVSDTAGPTATITSSFDVSCAGGFDGEATVTVTDGTPPYTFSWNTIPVQDTTGVSTFTATGLTAGTYTVTITDAPGCVTTQSVTINEPPALIAAITSSFDVSCNAFCNGSATVGVTGGTASYTYSWNTTPVQTTATATGLCAGTYNITITDANGCIAATTVIITEPTPLVLAITQTDVSCTGGCDGTATVTPGGGTGAYTYSWNTIPVQTTAIAAGLCAGTYVIQVTDNNGCIESSTVIIGEPVALSVAIITETGVDCNGDCDGYTEASASGGTGSYTYLWSDGQTAALATGLCTGIYTVSVTDANGCINSTTATINEPAVLTNTFSKVDVSCNSACDGQASALVSGGTLPYTYLWNDPLFQTTATAAGLCADTFTVIVTDSNGCSLTDNIIITEPPPVTLSITTTGANCGQADGGACALVSTGVAPFTYQWDDGSLQTTACATGLFSGGYNVLVTDATGCTATEPVTVNNLGAPTFVISSFGDASCFGACDGFATVLVTNGTAPYTYSWDDPLAQTTATATGLCAGNYIITVIDSNGCFGNVSVIIAEPTVLSVTISSITDATCNGDCDGEASVIVSGGTSAYTYQWNDPGLQTTLTATGLCAGTYGVTVSDANGCIATTSATISEPLVITLTTSAVGAHCGLSDGSASVTAVGGNGSPYGYLWTGGQNTATAVNLLAGTYTVVVTDILGCTDSATVTVNDIPPGTATISLIVDVSCNGDSDGTATVSMAGGTPPFTYLWDDGNSQTTVTATGLYAGIYNVDVTDSNGCVVTANAVINQPTLITITPANDSATCNGTCDGKVYAFPAGGTPPYNYLWDDPFTSTTNIVGSLCAGLYTVTVTDNKGCTAIQSTTIVEPTPILLTETHANANCGQADGIATVSVSGGTGPYVYLWSPPGNQTTPFISNVLAGTYIATVTDANGCSEDITITLINLLGPGALISDTNHVSCNGGWICNGECIRGYPALYLLVG